MKADVIDRRQLRNALRRNEIAVVYQPVIELSSGQCAGVEALVRWRRENGENVLPERFIPVAERLQCVDVITERVVDLVIRELGACLVSHPALHVAINVCPHDVSSGRILPLMEERLAGSGIHPAQVWLEVTEGSEIEVESARNTLAQARRRGHVVALDDFGVGYSNLRYLHELPCDVLKIDRAFVRGIAGDGPSPPILDCIIGMAAALGMKVVAEGVEDIVQARYLADAGVRYAQGWHFARPMSCTQLMAYLDAGNEAKAPPAAT
ncbi:EAL domain-containing protein [Herbaspirillum sp. NPDC087042]|uniref:EAL domain-containing protein n=1 Tax=Herbaspirillum sp. NPDC087042 TaxID=3364004 RepID=UPI00380ED963